MYLMCGIYKHNIYRLIYILVQQSQFVIRNVFYVKCQTATVRCKHSLNPLKPKLVSLIFKNSVRTSKRTPYLTITWIKWLTLFKEIIAVHIEYQTELINTKCIELL
jgi:hypothetical protein